MADSLIDKVVAIEARADGLVERARSEVKDLEEQTERRLKERQAQSQAELDRRRLELRGQMGDSLKQALEEEDRRFEELQAGLVREAEPRVEAVSEEVVRRFYQPGEGEDGH